MRLRIGIDVGGTFTDVTAFDEDQGEVIAIRKYSSNPGQPMLVMDQIAKEFHDEFGADSVVLILHGSTAALNTMLEGKGVDTSKLKISGNITNLADIKGISTINVTGASGGYGGFPIPPRMFFVTVSGSL